jgi:PleD family two-component response regulator
LVADDDELTRRLLQKALDRAGYEVVAVENGQKAIDCLSAKGSPRLALLDWLMPGPSGLEICREIRQHPEYPYIYMILLTSKSSKDDVVKGLEAGADDYLTKPFDMEELMARLRSGERVLQLEDKLNHDARHDALTQLPNRAFFLERLTLCVSWGILHPDHKFAVLSIDIDRFKIVTDSLGIAAGDWLLTQIAARLFGAVRRDDAVLPWGKRAEEKANWAEAAFLQARFCDEAQGYYFSRPVPVQQFAELLKSGILKPAVVIHA